jgi:hypothetical protein
MTELHVDFITTLDGYGAAEGWPGLWGLGWGPRPTAGLSKVVFSTSRRAVVLAEHAAGRP